MNKLIEFNVANGTVIVESSTAAESVVRGASLGQIAEKAGRNFVDTLSVIRPVAEAALAACRDLASVPEAIEFEFGLKFDVHLGAFIAAGGTGASLNIKLVWKPK
jgi:hypothetical protein